MALAEPKDNFCQRGELIFPRSSISCDSFPALSAPYLVFPVSFNSLVQNLPEDGISSQKKKKNHYKIMMGIILTGTKKPQQKGSNNPDINSFVWRDFQALLSFCLFVWEIEETFYFNFFSFYRQQKKRHCEASRWAGRVLSVPFPHWWTEFFWQNCGRLQEQLWFCKEIFGIRKFSRWKRAEQTHPARMGTRN